MRDDVNFVELINALTEIHRGVSYGLLGLGLLLLVVILRVERLAGIVKGGKNEN